MTDKVLGMDMIRNLLHSKTKGPKPETEKWHNKWPGPENMEKLAKAVAAKAQIVLFTNGDRFDIYYDLDDEAVLIKPSTGDFIPMGWFNYSKLRDAMNGVH